MGKKRKTSTHANGAVGEKEFNEKGGRMRPISTYEDVADSEDEFHMNRDKIMLEDEPDAKRRKKWEEEGKTLYFLDLPPVLTFCR
jgi:U3 small nucleolar RNA-associated protein 3